MRKILRYVCFLLAFVAALTAFIVTAKAAGGKAVARTELLDINSAKSELMSYINLIRTAPTDIYDSTIKNYTVEDLTLSHLSMGVVNENFEDAQPKIDKWFHENCFFNKALPWQVVQSSKDFVRILRGCYVPNVDRFVFIEAWLYTDPSHYGVVYLEYTR